MCTDFDIGVVYKARWFFEGERDVLHCAILVHHQLVASFDLSAAVHGDHHTLSRLL